jgi:site-specific recombinase XerC
MTRRPQPAPLTIRNGLKWREGKPRWEPSPASREAGLKGRDLRDGEGTWITDRGLAISICDARALWADMIREVLKGGAAGESAAADLRQTLDDLKPPEDEAGRLRRLLLEDVFDRARALLAIQDQASGVRHAHGPRTVALLVEAYFKAVERKEVEVADATRRAYKTQSKRVLAKFGTRQVVSLTQRDIYDWYHQELKAQTSLHTANLVVGAFRAFLAYARLQGWISVSPAVALKQGKAEGRRVFWTAAEEQAFIPWCDENGFADVADGVVAGLWAGARLDDICDANVADLAPEVWRFTPQKTKRHHQEAMPAVMPQLRARVDRRRQEAAQAQVRRLNADPLLVNPKTGKRHTIYSFHRRFKAAQAEAIAQRAMPADFLHKRHQDTRDTCITRLWEADVPPARMWAWTGHSQGSIERILKDHYLVLRAEGMAELADKLDVWAKRAGFDL